MAVLIVVVFILGYVLITFENPVKIDKAGTALVTGVLCWLVLSIGIEHMPAYTENPAVQSDTRAFIRSSLFEHIGKIAEILFPARCDDNCGISGCSRWIYCHH